MGAARGGGRHPPVQMPEQRPRCPATWLTFRPASALPRGGGRKGTLPQRRASRLSWTPPPASSAVRARVSHTARRARTPARTCVWGGRCPLHVSQLLLSCHFDLGDTTPAPTSSAHSGSTEVCRVGAQTRDETSGLGSDEAAPALPTPTPHAAKPAPPSRLAQRPASPLPCRTVIRAHHLGETQWSDPDSRGPSSGTQLASVAARAGGCHRHRLRGAGPAPGGAAQSPERGRTGHGRVCSLVIRTRHTSLARLPPRLRNGPQAGFLGSQL